jgi:hypothetical protein
MTPLSYPNRKPPIAAIALIRMMKGVLVWVWSWGVLVIGE